MSTPKHTASSAQGSLAAAHPVHHHDGEVLVAGVAASSHHHHHEQQPTAHNADAPASCCGSCGNQLNCSKAQAWHQE